MDLAPCAIGTGDADLFTMAVGGNYYAQTVGELALGSQSEHSKPLIKLEL